MINESDKIHTVDLKADLNDGLKLTWVSIRPKTLTAALIPIVVATSLALSTQTASIDRIWISFFALLSALFIQIGTNIVNDAIDFKTGADDQAHRIGPKRFKIKADQEANKLIWLGSLFFLFALVTGIPLVQEGGLAIVYLGILSILLGYAYTAGPFPLAYTGLGDIFVILFFGLIATQGVFWIYTHQISIPSLFAGFQVGCLATVLIAINNLRDFEGDAKVNKKTFAVRFGPRFVRFEIAALVLLPFLGALYWLTQAQWFAALLPLVLLPLAFKLIKNIFNTPSSEIYNTYLANAAKIHMLFGLLLSLGFFLKR